jgi:hypothetical protein
VPRRRECWAAIDPPASVARSFRLGTRGEEKEEKLDQEEKAEKEE